MSKVRELIVKITGQDAELSKALQRSARNIDGVSKKAQGLGKSLSKYITAPAIAAAGGVLVLVNRAAEFADTIDKTSIRTGVAREDLQRMRFAADQLGVSFDGVTGVVEALTRKIPELQQGTSSTARMFSAMGINVTDAQGNLRSMNDLFPDVIRGLSRVKNETERNAVASQLFGRRAFEIVPLLAAGGDEVERLMRRADELGIVMDDASIGSLVQYKDAMAEVKEQGAAVGREMALTLLPIIRDQFIPFLQASAIPEVRKWVGVLRELPPEAVQSAVKLIALTAALPPLIYVLGTAGRSVASMTRAWAAFRALGAGAAMAAMLSPTGILIGGLGLLAVGLLRAKMAAAETTVSLARLRAEMAGMASEQAFAKLTETAAALADVEAKLKSARAEQARAGQIEIQDGISGPYQMATRAVARLVDEQERLREQARGLSTALTRNWEAARRTTDAAGDLTDVLGAGGKAAADKAEKLTDLEMAQKRFNEQLLQASILQELLGEQYDADAAILSAYEGVVRALAAANVDLNAVVGPQGETFRALADTYLDLDKAARGRVETAREEKELEAELKRIREDIMTPLERYAAAQQRLNELLEAGALTQQEYTRAMVKAREELDELAKKGEQAADHVGDAMESMARSAEDAIVQLVSRGKLELGSLARFALGTFARLGIRMAAGALFGPAGAIGAGFLTGAAANGGRFGPGQNWLVGERGPEIITTGNSSGTIRPIQIAGGGGGRAGGAAGGASLPPYPTRMTPGEMAVDGWWREYVSHALTDAEDRGWRAGR